jgi:2-polyprenyl-6-hydroxyphenyl methylase/3-demethylubiquinone-9 3-methyltransferase
VADLHSLESGVQVRYKLIAAEDMAAQEAGQYDVVTCMEMLNTCRTRPPSCACARW